MGTRSSVPLVLLLALAPSLFAIAARAAPRSYTLHGTVRALIEPESVGDVQIVVPVEDCLVSTAGGFEGTTDEDGRFAIEVPQDVPYLLTVRLRGLYATVHNDDGPSAQIQAVAVPGEEVEILFDDASGTLAERNAYAHVNAIHDWIVAADPQFTFMDYALETHVNNLDSSCGAMWNEDEVTFYRESAVCNNTGRISDAVYHEVAHQITWFAYSPAPPPGSSGMAEAFSDLAAMAINDDPEIAENFLVGGGFLRTGENYRRFPGTECGGNPFCKGEILAGAMWKVRKNLVLRHGAAEGSRIFDRLHVRTMQARETTMPGYLGSLLRNDDDDGDLQNGTPHYLDICEGFAAHRLPCPPLGDDLVIESDPLDDLPAGEPAIVTALVRPIGGGAIDPSSVEIVAARTCAPEDPPSWTEIPMEPTGTPDEYTGTIPTSGETAFVRYYIRAAKESGVTATDPPQAPYRATHRFAVGTVETVLADDAEVDRGWSLGWTGDDATAGIWQRVDPSGKSSDAYGVTQPEDDHTAGSGIACFVTDGRGGGWSAEDVDGGRTSLVSPSLPGLGAGAIGSVRFWAFLFDTPQVDDTLRCSVSYDDGSTWEDVASIAGSDARDWTFRRADFVRRSGAGAVRVRFAMEDGGMPTDCAEAAVDDVEIRWIRPAGCLTGVPDEGPPPRAGLTPAGRNPSHERFAFRWRQTEDGPLDVGVHDAGGRRVRDLRAGTARAGETLLTWDGRDDEGRPVGSGAYFLVVRGRGGIGARASLILIR